MSGDTFQIYVQEYFMFAVRTELYCIYIQTEGMCTAISYIPNKFCLKFVNSISMSLIRGTTDCFVAFGNKYQY